MVSNQASGDVSVFLNDPSHSFATGYRFRVGTGLYGLATTAGPAALAALQQSVSVAAGHFTGSGNTDLVVVNRGTDSFSVLAGNGTGGFTDPSTALTTSTSAARPRRRRPAPWWRGISTAATASTLTASAPPTWRF